MNKEWVIQKFNKDLKLWEFMTPKDQLMTREEMIKELEQFERNYPNIDFRGHNFINNEKHNSDHYK